MKRRSIQLEFHRDYARWHATTTVAGALYSVWGRHPKGVLADLCTMLHICGDRWRIVTLMRNKYCLEELPYEAPPTELPSTEDFPCLAGR